MHFLQVAAHGGEGILDLLQRRIDILEQGVQFGIEPG